MTIKEMMLPPGVDAEFVRQQAGVEVWSIYASEDGEGMILAYEQEREEYISGVLAKYDDLYLPVLRSRVLAEVSQERDNRILAFTFNGLPIQLDETAKANITGAVAGLERDPSMATISWSLGEGEFIVLPREAIFALGRAAFAHVQSCFAAHKRVAGAVKALSTVTELRDLDVPSHPAWN